MTNSDQKSKTKKQTFQMLDTAVIKVSAGNGGDGRVSFRHEKYVAKGGPDGGDGGNGGSVYFVADNNMETLLDFRGRTNFKAQDGEMGGKKNMTGADGPDLYIKVPVGTLIFEAGSSRQILVADMNETGKQFLIAKGGKGGRGNSKFRSSVNQAPTQYTAGTLGEEKTINLEIKLVADVGLIGFPNAGKSTLLNALTRANAKVSNYPFTTLNPNLGTLRLKDGKEVIFADIPGLIEGASQGKGLGDEFLRHIERTRMLVHVIDPTDFSYSAETDYLDNALKVYDILRQELKQYNPALLEKEEIIVINKLDITELRSDIDAIKKAFEKKGKIVIGVSAAAQEGLDVLVDTVLAKLNKIEQKPVFETEKPVKLFNITNLPNKKLVFNNDILDWEGNKKVD